MTEKKTTLYKYVPLEYAETILDNSRLYLNDGKSFNDPFELSITDRKTGKIKYVEGLHVLSLTNSYRKKLMWSHYAASHRGICLTVVVPNRLVYPICYSTQRVYEDSDIDQIIEKSRKKQKQKKSVEKSFSQLSDKKKYAYIKDKKWIYEKEYRIVFDENDEAGLIFENGNWYMPVKIKNVYLGVHFYKNDSNCKDKILKACERNRIKTTQMIFHSNHYEIKPENKQR